MNVDFNKGDFLDEDNLFGDGGSSTQPSGNGGIMNNGIGSSGNVSDNSDDNGGNNTPPVQNKADNADENRIFQELNRGFAESINNQSGDSNKNQENPLQITDNDDFAIAILKQNGINPNAIPVSDENGNQNLISFGDLSRQEQIDMIQSISGNQQQNGGYQLEDDEVDMINAIRRSGMSPEQYMNALRDRFVNEYIQNGGGEQQYQVDSLSDDELWLSDYHAKVKNASEEDALRALEYAKSNPDLFNKTMEGMRQMYKENEENSRTQDMQRQEELAKQVAADYESAIVDAVNSNSRLRFGDDVIDLSKDDKEEIASFILDRDPSGENYMVGAMKNQNELVKMAFMYLKGEELINEMQEAHKRELANTRNDAYSKGFNDARSGKNQSYVVNRPGIKNRPSVQKIASLNDIEDKLL